MIEKLLIGLIFCVALVGAGVTYGWYAGAKNIQVRFDKYKGEVREQIQAAKVANAATEAKQDAKHDAEASGFNRELARLRAILAGLPNTGTVPRNPTLPVADSNGNTLPKEATDTSRFTQAPTIGVRATDIDVYYSMSMSDTLQCSRLIEFLK